MNIGQLNKRIEFFKQSFAEDPETGTDEPAEVSIGKTWRTSRQGQAPCLTDEQPKQFSHRQHTQLR